MTIKHTDNARRSITETHHTGKPDVVLAILTSHNKNRKGYLTTVHRRQVTPVGFIEVPLTPHDPAPVAATLTPAARHSLKALEEAHENFIATHVAGTDQHAHLIEWAERYA